MILQAKSGRSLMQRARRRCCCAMLRRTLSHGRNLCRRLGPTVSIAFATILYSNSSRSCLLTSTNKRVTNWRHYSATSAGNLSFEFVRFFDIASGYSNLPCVCFLHFSLSRRLDVAKIMSFAPERCFPHPPDPDHPLVPQGA